MAYKYGAVHPDKLLSLSLDCQGNLNHSNEYTMHEEKQRLKTCKPFVILDGCALRIRSVVEGFVNFLIHLEMTVV